MKRDRHPEQQLQHYLVGGAVRDRLLGHPVKDRDWVVVGSRVSEMLALGFKPVGKDFPVFLHPVTAEEYALARTERKSGHGYSGFVCHADPSVTLEDDLRRRDLTINAMAEAPDGTLIDPYHGLQDLNARCLRHVSAAFSEDPLRILRVARFAARYAALGFQVVDETLALMQQMVVSGEASHLVPERVWQETVRALAEPTPTRYFKVLHDCGALAVILPPIAQALDAHWSNVKALELAQEASPLERFGCIASPLAAEKPQAMIQALERALRLPREYLDLIRLQAQTQSLWPELEQAPPPMPLLCCSSSTAQISGAARNA